MVSEIKAMKTEETRGITMCLKDILKPYVPINMIDTVIGEVMTCTTSHECDLDQLEKCAEANCLRVVE